MFKNCIITVDGCQLKLIAKPNRDDFAVEFTG